MGERWGESVSGIISVGYDTHTHCHSAAAELPLLLLPTPSVPRPRPSVYSPWPTRTRKVTAT